MADNWLPGSYATGGTIISTVDDIPVWDTSSTFEGVQYKDGIPSSAVEEYNPVLWRMLNTVGRITSVL